MWRAAVIIVISIVLFPFRGLSQVAPDPLTNQDVVAMTKGGLDDSTISAALQIAPNHFDLSPDALLGLKQQGVSAQVMDAMLAARAKNEGAAEPAQAGTPAGEAGENAPQEESKEAATAKLQRAPDSAAQMLEQMQRMGYSLPPQYAAQLSSALRQARAMGFAGSGMGFMGAGATGTSSMPERLPEVKLIWADHSIGVRASTAQIAQTEVKGGSGRGTSMLTTLGTQALSFAAIGAGGMFAAPAVGLAGGMLGGFGHHAGMPATTYVWALPGQKSALVSPTVNPKMEVEFGDIVGVDPDAYEAVLVKLVQTKDNYRLIGATKEKMDKKGNETRTGITEERVASHNIVLGRGHVQVEPATPLTPGEYALVLHPIKPVKTAAGAPGNNDWIFYSAWDFSVGAAQPVNAGDLKRN